MRGVPKWFNTVEDVENSMGVDKEATKAKVQEMLDGRFSWFVTGTLGAKEKGVEDETHKVVATEDMESGKAERLQYELREDPNAWLFRIGLTVEKAHELMEA